MQSAATASGVTMSGKIACVAPVGDWAIDANTALLFSPEAPLVGSAPRDDQRTVWAFVPASLDYAKFETLFYFHGHNNYVKVGYCDHKTGLKPDWLRAVRRVDLGPTAAGPKYELDKLPTDFHSPLVLVPEVGTDNPASSDPKYAAVFASEGSYETWRKQRAKYLKEKEEYDKAKKNKVTPLPPEPVPPTPSDVPFAVVESRGKLADPDGQRIQKIINDCCDRLRKLPKRDSSAATTYLEVAPDKKVDASKLKRLYLSGHSGGGVPLSAACTNTIARLKGPDDTPTDLWVLDATYGSGLNEYSSFCKELFDAKKLGNGSGLSRFVGVVIKNSPTDVSSKDNPPPRMTDIVAKMKSEGLPVKEVEFKKDSDLPELEKALMCNPIVIIRQTAVEHDRIPTKFIPILLRTAGRKGTDCGGTAPLGFKLEVIDTNEKPLAGAKVKVLQEGKLILASKLSDEGTAWVEGHSFGQPCDVNVEGFGGLGLVGHLDPDAPDDGKLPEYDPGKAQKDTPGCGGDYSPPVIT
jgi:hypothetical protein